jgi:hypothetical protein
MELSPSCDANWFSASQEIPRSLTPVCSLPRLQFPATCPYPEPDQSIRGGTELNSHLAP